MTTLENNLAVYYKGNTYLPYDPAIAALAALTLYVHAKICTQMFTAPLLTITEN